MITIIKDVSGVDYASLIATACKRYPQFSLVWRDQLSFEPSARSIQQELRGFQLARSRTSRWPGTRLLGSRADVIRYSIDAARTGVLSRSRSLFGWCAPQLPEDLCFYKSDGSSAIVTVAHEHQAWFFDDDWLTLLPATAGARHEHLSHDGLLFLQPNASEGAPNSRK